MDEKEYKQFIRTLAEVQIIYEDVMLKIGKDVMEEIERIREEQKDERPS